MLAYAYGAASFLAAAAYGITDLPGRVWETVRVGLPHLCVQPAGDRTRSLPLIPGAVEGNPSQASPQVITRKRSILYYRFYPGETL